MKREGKLAIAGAVGVGMVIGGIYLVKRSGGPPEIPPAPAGYVSILGRVVNEGGSPLKGVTVSITSAYDEPLEFLTESGGYYAFYAQKNQDVVLSFSKSGYVSSGATYHIGEADVEIEDFVLIKEAAPPEVVDLILGNTLAIHGVCGHKFSDVGVGALESKCPNCKGTGQVCGTYPWTGQYICIPCSECNGTGKKTEYTIYAIMALPISKSKLDGVTLQFDYIGPSRNTDVGDSGLVFGLWHRPQGGSFGPPQYGGYYAAPTTGEGIVGGYRVWVVPFGGSVNISTLYGPGYYSPQLYDLRLYYGIGNVQYSHSMIYFVIKDAIKCTGSGVIQ